MKKSIILTLGLLLAASSFNINAMEHWKKYARKAAGYTAAIGAAGYCLKNLSFTNVEERPIGLIFRKYGPLFVKFNPFLIAWPVEQSFKAPYMKDPETDQVKIYSLPFFNKGLVEHVCAASNKAYEAQKRHSEQKQKSENMEKLEREKREAMEFERDYQFIKKITKETKEIIRRLKEEGVE